ncbi:MAG TPA: flagellar export protein FliJ [Nevskiaceae bacterium]|nr:flagellar export protein FliJ [Nevskiaceae bacterium]
MSGMTSKRMKPIQRVAETREDSALEAFLELQRVASAAQTRLEELTDYLSTYTRTAATAITPAMLINRHAFMSKLRDAIEYQRNEVTKANAACQAQRARWILASRDVRVLDKLSEAYRSRERSEAERSAQREIDDRVVRKPGLP